MGERGPRSPIRVVAQNDQDRRQRGRRRGIPLRPFWRPRRSARRHVQVRSVRLRSHPESGRLAGRRDTLVLTHRARRPALPAPAGQGALFTAIAVEAFRFHGVLIALGNRLGAGAGLTSARWQVLAALALAGRALTSEPIL